MSAVDVLPSVEDFFRFRGIRVDELELPCEVVGISDLEEDEVAVREVIADSTCPRSNDRFPQGQTLKNTGRSIDFSESAFPIWNDAYVALSNYRRYAVVIPGPEIFDVVGQTTLRRRVHGLRKERCTLSANHQSRFGNGTTDLGQGVDRNVEAIPMQ